MKIDMDDSREKKNIIIGKLTEAYSNIPKRIIRINENIELIRDRYAAVKAVSFEQHTPSGKSMDEKLAEMISKIDLLEEEKNKLNLRKIQIFEELRVCRLTDKEKIVLKAVFETRTYTEAGERIGYSKTEIYRTMERIYRKMSNYI